MAAPNNGSGNLVEEFEESFQACLNVLTKQEALPCVEKDEVKVEVERFIELARQMEAFFLQKRFLLSALKPELLVKEDNSELRLELARKDELLRRHYDKIGVWQNLLADLQGYAKSPAQNASAVAGATTAVTSGATQLHPAAQMQQSAMQQAQQLQAQHQHGVATQHLAQQQMSSGMGQGMYMQARGQYPQATMQGPLAYLEKTTTNIDLVGMGDGRR